MSDDDSALDIRFTGRQLKLINDRLGALEDNMTVLTAMVIRMDGTVSGLTNELRAIHSQHSRMQNRVRVLEKAQDGSAEP